MISWIKKTDNQTDIILSKLQKRKEPVMLYGAALCGKQYLQILRNHGVNVACFIDDDKTKQEKGFAGLPVIPVRALSTTGGRIVISSYGPEKLERRLLSINRQLASRIVKPDFYLWDDSFNYTDYYSAHEDEIKSADNLLSDKKSHKVFHNLLQYKISRDKSLIEEIRDNADLQYFDPDIIEFSSDEVFLDLGAYIGDTVEAFASKVNGEYERIIALEPDKINFKKLCDNTKEMQNVECYPFGIGANNEKMRFLSDGTWTSAVGDTGNTEIEIKTVDSFMKHKKLTFMKADIEGLEKSMLQGAEKVIREQKPKLAIAVYHCKEDIFTIINTINRYCQEYRFYMRHYTEMPIDTVLYAV